MTKMCILSASEEMKIKEAINAAKMCLYCVGITSKQKSEAIESLITAQTIFIKKDKKRNETTSSR